MPRVKTAKTNSKPPAWPQIRVRPENLTDLSAIGNEWRMNLQETIAALIDLWQSSTDETKVNAIRRPARETVPA